jgi:hypothetical protein
MNESDPARPPRPADLRISDDDRHQVAEVLRRAAGEGRLDLDELEERLESAFAAKTYGQLEPLVRDLPVHESAFSVPGSARPAVQRGPVPLPSPGVSVAVMSGVERRGAWTLAERHTAVAVMGGVELDLRDAELPAEATVTALAVMGGVTVVVDQFTRVDVDGIGLMGGFGESRSRTHAVLGPGSPVVRVRGLALMGGVEVVRRPRRGDQRDLAAPRPPELDG